MPGEVKLLPCPFCGGEAKLNPGEDIECGECGIYMVSRTRTFSRDAFDTLIEEWNRRALPENAIREAAREIVQEFIAVPCREVYDDGNASAWISDVAPESIESIIRRHLEGLGY